jgi:hypothetical protein
VRLLRRLLVRLKEYRDKSVIHGLKGKPSLRRIKEETEQEAVRILSARCTRDSGRPWRGSICGSSAGLRQVRRRCGSG